MKIYLYIIGLILLFPLHEAHAQMFVDSKYTRWQLEREVIKRWGEKKKYLLFMTVRDKFQPYWYFLATHREYMLSDDKRNMLQLAPTLLFTQMVLDSARAEQKDVEVKFKNTLAKGADRVLNKRWELTEKARFNALYLLIDSELEKTDNFYKIPERSKIDLRETYLTVKEKVSIIKDSYIDDAEKGEAFLTYYAELQEYYHRITSMNKTVSMMEKYDFVKYGESLEN